MELTSTIAEDDEEEEEEWSLQSHVEVEEWKPY
jgi:hypothetical protein